MNNDKKFVLWNQKLDVIFYGHTQQECVDQMLDALWPERRLRAAA